MSAIPDRGHQTIVYVLPKDRRRRRPTSIRRKSPSISATAKKSGAAGAASAARLIGAPGEIFPNIALLPRQPRTIAVWHPRGAHQTEVWRWFLVDRDAPAGGQRFPARLLHPLFGPGRNDRAGRHGELELRPRRRAAARSPAAILIATRWGIGAAESRISSGTGCACRAGSIDITKAQSSEEPMRNLYRRWAQFMEADSWADLATWRHASEAHSCAAPAPGTDRPRSGPMPTLKILSHGRRPVPMADMDPGLRREDKEKGRCTE